MRRLERKSAIVQAQAIWYIFAPNAGGIVGRLYGDSKVINSYVTGKLTPVGNGTTDVGGIVGSVAGGSVSDCYFAGEIDLSQYSAKKPYTRFGGIVGRILVYN